MVYLKANIINFYRHGKDRSGYPFFVRAELLDLSYIVTKKKVVADSLAADQIKQKNMNQYLITAHDGNDENALERRMSARPAHLELVKALKESGNFVMGGAHLSEANTMKGSTLVVQFESENELNEYLAKEPYIKQGVWASYTVVPFKVAVV